MRTASFRPLLLAGSVLTATAAPALALDSDDLIAKLQAAMEVQSAMSFTYDSVEQGSGGDVTLTGVVFSAEPVGPDAEVELKQVEPITLLLEDVRESDDGSYIIGKSTVSDISFVADELEISIGRMTENNVYVPATAGFEMLAGWGYGETGEIENITATANGTTFLTVDHTSMAQDFNEARTRAGYLVNMTGLTLDLGGIDDMESDDRAMLEQLQLLRTSSNVTIDGSWDLETGSFAVSSYSIETENVGTLDFSMELTGLTLETMETLQNLSELAQNEAMEPEDGDTDETSPEESPYQKYVLELGQKIGVSGLSIRFTDDSITTRALQYAAEQEGITAEEMADKIEVDLGNSLTALNVPGLSEMVTGAVGAYFADPGTFTISIKPQMQMPVLAVIMAGAAAPQSIPQLLNLQVTANE